MYSSVMSGAIHGVDGAIIYVESDVSDGLPAFSLVGLLSSEVKEAGDRVRNAIRNSGIRMTPKRITINLSPADIRKSGSAFDLAIAVAVLCGYEYLNEKKCRQYLYLGELGLDGTIKPVKGVLPIVDAAMRQGITKCIVPVSNLKEAKLVKGMQVFGVDSLSDLISHFLRNVPMLTEAEDMMTLEKECVYDFKDVKGQAFLKRAVTVAACGMHNVLIGGPPGSGKSMVAKRLPGILPDLTYQESLELTKIYSVCGMLSSPGELMKRRPFRAPHHTISHSALIGGGMIPRPGEISLAHRGVLFLDEFPEFNRNAIEVLRQPLEDRHVTISRVNASYTFPADFMLVAAMNMCPCGFYPDRNRCTCTPLARQRYQNHISQPILDRMDIQVLVEPVQYEDLYEKSCSGEADSKTIKEQIQRVHILQQKRYEGTGILFNSQLTGSLLNEYCSLDKQCRGIMKMAYDRLKLSARASERVLRVARSIADLDGKENIEEVHLMEALTFREMEGMTK